MCGGAHTQGHLTVGGIEDRIDFDVAAGLEAEDRAAVVEQVELDIAAAPHLLLVPVGLRPRRREIAAHDRRIDREEGLADVAGEGEILVRIARPVIVVEDAADAAHLAAMLEEEVLVAPRLVALVVGGRVALAGAAHRGMEGEGVRIVLRPPPVEHRGEIGAAAEPGLRRHDEARVHVHGRNVRVPRMRDHRDAGRPEARVLGRARDLAAELRREFAVHGRDVDADLLEHAAAHQRHDAAAAGRAAVVGARPGLAREAAGARRVRDRTAPRPRPRAARARRRCGRAAPRTRSARRPAGGGRARSRARTGFSGARYGTGGAGGKAPGGKAPVCRSASPRIIAAATATLSERRPGRIGTTMRASAAAWTSSGTPADSRPTRTTSVALESELRIRHRRFRRREHEAQAAARRETPRRRARKGGA